MPQIIEVGDGIARLEFPDDADDAEIEAGVEEFLASEEGRVATVRNPLKGIPGGDEAPTAPPPPDPVEPGLWAGAGKAIGIDPATTEDIVKSAVYRGLPEAAAASTIGGLALNTIRGVSDLTRWGLAGGHKILTGEELPRYTPNPVPTSSDVLQSISKAATGEGLYEPKTTAGKYSNTITQFAGGGAATRVPSGAIVESAVPAAILSEAAGQATEGTKWEPAARMVGAVGGGLSIPASSRIVNKKPTQITADDIKAQSHEAYKVADEKGGVLNGWFTNKFLDEANKVKPQTEAGKLIAGDSAAAKVVDKLQSLKNRRLTLNEAQEIDEFLGDTIDSLTELGRVTKQGKKILDIQTSFRNMIDDADASTIAGGKEGFDAWKQGRELWSKQARLRDIEKIITRAEQMENPATGIKTGFRTLYNNPSRLRGFSKVERALIKEAAESGIISDTLRTLGSRLVPIITGAAGGGLPATVAAQAGSMASRGLATKIQVGKANKVANTIAGSKKASPKAPINYKQSLPPITAVIGQGVNR